jgi:hypothetical protein
MANASRKKWVTSEAIEDMTAYHPPSNADVATQHLDIRTATKNFMIAVNDIAPECPEKTTAINKAREAMFWANAAIACHANKEV